MLVLRPTPMVRAAAAVGLVLICSRRLQSRSYHSHALLCNASYDSIACSLPLALVPDLQLLERPSSNFTPERRWLARVRRPCCPAPAAPDQTPQHTGCYHLKLKSQTQTGTSSSPPMLMDGIACVLYVYCRRHAVRHLVHRGPQAPRLLC